MDTGGFGCKKINFDGKEIYEENLYSVQYIDGVKQCRFFEYDFSSVNECQEYNDYMKSPGKSGIYCSRKELFDLAYVKK